MDIYGKIRAGCNFIALKNFMALKNGTFYNLKNIVIFYKNLIC